MIIVNDSIHMTRGEFFIHYFWLEFIIIIVIMIALNKPKKKRGNRK